MFNIKNLTKKIKNKKLKGNISLLVILILLATSVITLLSINQIMRLISYWNQTFNYFRAYYLAKAWTELWLAEVYNRGDGFNNKIPSDSSIVSWNLLEEYSAFNPYFDTTITWSFIYLTNDVRKSDSCDATDDNDNRITLWPGEWIMLSLFSDNTTKTKEILSTWNNENENYTSSFNINNNFYPTQQKIIRAIFSYKDDTMEYIEVKTWSLNDLISYLWGLYHNEYLNDPSYRTYLTIKNSINSQDIKFCIEATQNKPIPYSNSLITTIWHYGDTEVWIQSIVKKWVPDWTLNVLDQVSPS